MNTESKVTSEHLKRRAYLYVRQSTLRQVLENTESTKRQYALRQRALALGWPEECIIVIDHDQAQSAQSAADREGFQRLVAEVGMGKAGIVMGLEVSRLARNCADWHRLLEICALTHTLILDEDGLYDSAHFNDRLLLGLKATMSEAELHVLKARLVGGVISKAQRAELKMPLPIGLVYDLDHRVVLDPDQQVQQSMALFFTTFEKTGSAWRTVQAFRQQGWKFPRRGKAGSGDVRWQGLTHRIALETLHNPRYAGAFCFGRSRAWKDAEGTWHYQNLPREQWRFLKQDAHPDYLTWDQFLANESRLLDNHQAHGGRERKAGPPREGPALLQGLAGASRRVYCRFGHQFLQWRFGKLSPRPEQIRRSDLVRFVECRAKNLRPRSLRLLTISLRSFLRFLQTAGRVKSTLVAAVPSLPAWERSKAPQTLSRKQLGDLLHSFNRSTPLGRRDFAMTLCMTELGLRVSEVAHLSLDDVDWRKGTMRLVKNKSGRERLLPLPARVGRALVSYLRSGRPHVPGRRVFLCHHFPRGTPLEVFQISYAIRQAYARAGIPATRVHLLRHTFATNLHQRGASIKALADLLGHKSLESTTIYTRINLKQLRLVALPWPRAAS